MEETNGDTLFQADGLFSIAAPQGWCNARDPDVPLLLADESLDGSGIFIDFKTVDWPQDEAKERLIEASETFFNDSVLKVETREFVDLKSLVWGDDECECIRTWAFFSAGYTWLIQFVHWPTRNILYILHWNGPTQIAEELIHNILDTFMLLEAGNEREIETAPPPIDGRWDPSS